MNSFFRNAAVATILSLSLAPVANAAPSDSATIAQFNVSQSSAPLLVAQAMESKPVISTKFELLQSMLNQYMTMRKLGQSAMQSSDPEIQRMGREIVKSSEDQILKLIKMMRAEFLANPDR